MGGKRFRLPGNLVNRWTRHGKRKSRKRYHLRESMELKGGVKVLTVPTFLFFIFLDISPKLWYTYIMGYNVCKTCGACDGRCGILLKRKRHRQTFAQLKAENTQLKKIVALTQRKVEHGCAAASCSLCDPEQSGDGTWEFSS